MHFIGNEMETPLFVKMHFSCVLQFQFMLQTVNPIDAFKVLSTTAAATTTTTTASNNQQRNEILSSCINGSIFLSFGHT
jgi:hypothetical protein